MPLSDAQVAPSPFSGWPCPAMNKLNTLRWIGFLPAAFLGGIAGLFGGHLVAQVLNWFWLDTFTSMGALSTDTLLCGLGMAFGFMKAASWVRPEPKERAKSMLVGLAFIIGAGFLVLFSWNHQWWSVGTTLIFVGTVWVTKGDPE